MALSIICTRKVWTGWSYTSRSFQYPRSVALPVKGPCSCNQISNEFSFKKLALSGSSKIIIVQYLILSVGVTDVLMLVIRLFAITGTKSCSKTLPQTSKLQSHILQFSQNKFSLLLMSSLADVLFDLVHSADHHRRSRQEGQKKSKMVNSVTSRNDNMNTMLHGEFFTMLRMYTCYTKGSRSDKVTFRQCVRKKMKIYWHLCFENVVSPTLALTSCIFVHQGDECNEGSLASLCLSNEMKKFSGVAF